MTTLFLYVIIKPRGEFMKLKECISKSIPKVEMDEALNNIKDFDFTELDDTEIFDAIKGELKECELYISGPINLELANTTVHTEVLFGGKKYPCIWMNILANYCDNEEEVTVRLDPFTCICVDSDIFLNERAGKKIARVFAEFMINRFGKNYEQIRKAHFRKIKNIKIDAAQLEAQTKIDDAEEEYRENVFGI